jgi:hypothetical protein
MRGLDVRSIPSAEFFRADSGSTRLSDASLTPARALDTIRTRANARRERNLHDANLASLFLPAASTAEPPLIYAGHLAEYPARSFARSIHTPEFTGAAMPCGNAFVISGAGGWIRNPKPFEMTHQAGSTKPLKSEGRAGRWLMIRFTPRARVRAGPPSSRLATRRRIP